MSFPSTHPSAPRLYRGGRIVRRRAPVGAYDPKLVGTMLSAFASACSQLAAALGTREQSRRNLARRILIHVDEGECNAQHLADLASNDIRRQIGATAMQ